MRRSITTLYIHTVVIATHINRISGSVIHFERHRPRLDHVSLFVDVSNKHKNVLITNHSVNVIKLMLPAQLHIPCISVFL